MAQVKVKLDRQGVLEVLNSQGVHDDIQRRVDAVRNAANNAHNSKGYKGDVIKTDRPHGAVWAADKHACASNAKYNTLMKALDAGRGD